jgi:hypothetical protein
MQGQQLELELFFPLTEQIPLGLDFTPCEEYAQSKWNNKIISGSVLLATNGLLTNSSVLQSPPSFEIKPSSTTAGYYKFGGSTFHIYLEKKPSALTRWAMAKVFNFYWNDK